MSKKLTIRHSHAEGTTIEGTARGDGSAEVLKANKWRWGRSISAWFVPFSRDKLPNTFTINRTAEALRAAGFEVELEVSLDVRPTAEVEADKADRQEGRVEALAAKAGRKADAAEEAWKRSEDTARPLIEMGGQPILVGHHSEQRHRNLIEKSRRATRRALDADADAAEAERRAGAAAVTTARRYNPVTVGNRIARLEADLRKVERQIEGDRRYVGPYPYRAGDLEDEANWEVRKPSAGGLAILEARRAELADQLAYWRGIRDDQVANGESFGPGSIKVGDRVAYWFGPTWGEVIRVNQKSVTVKEDYYGWQRRIGYHEIKGHQPKK